MSWERFDWCQEISKAFGVSTYLYKGSWANWTATVQNFSIISNKVLFCFSLHWIKAIFSLDWERLSNQVRLVHSPVPLLFKFCKFLFCGFWGIIKNSRDCITGASQPIITECSSANKIGKIIKMEKKKYKKYTQ